MNAKQITEAILKSLNKENAPVGILIEAVIEKEFTKYEELLSEIKEHLVAEVADDYTWANTLVRKIDKTKEYVD